MDRESERSREGPGGDPRPFRRWGRVGLTVAVAFLVAGCLGEGERPGEPIEGAEPSVIEEGTDGIRTVRSPNPLERIRVRNTPPEGRARLLFMNRRAASRLASGEVALPDPDAGRVIVFDDRGRPTWIAQGGPDDGPPLGQPFFAVDGSGRLEAVEGDGRILTFGPEGPEGWNRSALPLPPVAGRGGLRVATRTIFDVQVGRVNPSEPLLWIEGADGTVVSAGRVRRPDEAFLGGVVNSGWAAVGQEEDVIWASVVRPELIRFSARDGSPLLRMAWDPAAPPEPPRLGVREGTLTPRFTILQTGVTPGPDGLLYLLATSRPAGLRPPTDANPDSTDYLLAFDEDGTLLRAGAVPRGHAVFADARGGVHTIPPDVTLARTPEADRALFPPFELPDLEGPGRIALEEYRGRIVVLNFWASWCGPCRDEMPLLDEMAQAYDPDEVAVVGLNEDVTPSDALRFLEELGGVSYPNAQGEGRMKERYGYRGLPYTVILDREGRVARTIYGFGTTIEPIERAVGEELARASSSVPES